MYAKPSLSDKGIVIRHTILENRDRDGWVRIYDFRVRKYRLVFPGDAMALCLAGVATIEPPMKGTEREQY